ncbi:MAG TPA: hypothetical protein DGG95_16195 [Cytophagales bacterium]|jgi:hypothetical protein|nr:hypothetical protein [Cytophagales bacterium]
MKHFVITVQMVLLILVSCTSKNTGSRVDSGTKSTIALKDTFSFDGKNFLKRYQNEGGVFVTKSQEVNFYEPSQESINVPEIIIKSTLNTFKHPSNYPVYKLKIEEFELSNGKHKILWSKDIEDETPLGTWENYFRTEKHGCCASEDGSVLYDLRDGKEFIRCSGEIKYSHMPTSGYLIYHSSSSVTFKNENDTTLMGAIYYLTTDQKRLQKLFSYRLHFKDESIAQIEDKTLAKFIERIPIWFTRTPQMEVIAKSVLSEVGFFKSFKLFKKGEELNSIDTSKYYVKLNYGLNDTVLIPIDENNALHETELVTTKKTLSNNLWVERLKDQKLQKSK